MSGISRDSSARAAVTKSASEFRSSLENSWGLSVCSEGFGVQSSLFARNPVARHGHRKMIAVRRQKGVHAIRALDRALWTRLTRIGTPSLSNRLHDRECFPVMFLDLLHEHQPNAFNVQERNESRGIRRSLEAPDLWVMPPNSNVPKSLSQSSKPRAVSAPSTILSALLAITSKRANLYVKRSCNTSAGALVDAWKRRNSSN